MYSNTYLLYFTFLGESWGGWAQINVEHTNGEWHNPQMLLWQKNCVRRGWLMFSGSLLSMVIFAAMLECICHNLQYVIKNCIWTMCWTGYSGKASLVTGDTKSFYSASKAHYKLKKVFTNFMFSISFPFYFIPFSCISYLLRRSL